MDELTTLITVAGNLGFAIAVAAYLLVKTNNVLHEVVKTLCELKNSIRLLAEKIEILRK
ncbi:MAG: YvrJ family protein [Candidatus Thermoplasmatota archaeon]|nr:YvrJ family protein [Candidatus Thermoplasmatota archaeon]